ncbi:hypothetical protein B0T20DRAFT_402556 [Sordaria brevicollis]|uniref:Uncharacterized protein n=1 Tax=Sordaria brevicollis TaxID=83679 RepID=A0AAE0UFR9_SORBR|nr:hypothetical protein B0T20DRAFT_402556 [Sordaria brevicollis]
MPNEKPVAAAKPDSSSSTTNDGYVRLHVSPLDAELLPVVLNSSLLPKARNVSFHTIETFPEKRYGFVELPKEDAEKVRKKFHGAVLRGAKMKVDPAKPDKNPKPLGEEVALEDQEKKKKKEKAKKAKKELFESRESRETHHSSKKRKREEITGVVLEEGRQVKRGWTSADEPKKERKDKRDKKKSKDEKEKEKKKKDKKKERLRSKYTDHDECLVKTVLPPNKVANADDVEGLTKKKKKDNKREVVVHEFAKTTKFPTFLKTATTSGSKKTPLKFDEERKCWVDEDGNVVEEVKASRNPKTGLLTLDAGDLPPLDNDDDDSSSSSDEDEVETRIIKLYHESSSESEDEDDEKEQKEEKKEDSPEDEGKDQKDGSSSESEEEKSSDEKEEAPKDSAPEPTKDESDAESSSDSSEDEDDDAPPAKKAKTSTPPPTSKADTKATSSPTNKNQLSIRIPPPPATPVITKTEVHPLEALYKKPKDGAEEAAQPATGFSFFGGNNDDIEEEEEEVSTRTTLQVPLTPYTEKDFESRGLRSAAPTPDTAHPSRRFKPWEDDNEENDQEGDEDEEMVDGVAAGGAEDGTGGNGAEATSDFQKWFWEHRGDLNRSWKKRRKLVGKEKRYRENRARMARAI